MTKTTKNSKTKISKEIAAALQLITDNFSAFTSEVVGFENAQFHKELDDNISKTLYKKLCIALPRGHGKTSHLSVAYPLWEIAKNHNVRILLVSSTAEVTRSFMTEIRNHIESNEKYQLWAKSIDKHGRGVTPKLRNRQKREEHWSGDSIIISRDDLKLKDPTINAIGLFGSILSRRADIIIVDDLCNQENSATEEQRQKVKDWLHTTLLPVLVPGGRFIYLGNTWHMDDLVSNLLKDPQFDIKKRMPAISHEALRQDLWQKWGEIYLDESLTPETKKEKADKFYAEHKKEMDEGIEVLWPERYPYGDLYLKRLSNPYSFARMYQCDPSIRPNQRFQESEIEKALLKGKDLILQDGNRDGMTIEYTTSGLDLAISQKSGSDDTVLLSLDKVQYGQGEIKAGDYVIRNIQRGKFLPNYVRNMVESHNEAVKPDGIRVETVGYQEMMFRDLDDRGLPVTSYHTGGEKNDPDVGVNSLAIILSQGKLVLPYDRQDPRTIKLVTELVNEMRAYPDGHTGDALMALWFAFSEMRDRSANKIIIPEMETPQQSAPKNQKEAEREIDRETMLFRDAQRSNDPIAGEKYVQFKKKKDKEAWKDEELAVFNKMMGRC